MENDDLDLHTVPISSLKPEALILLSCLLNSTKILLSDGPERLPRDWRGLARLLNISSEIASSFQVDKTAEIRRYWLQRRDGTATVGKLLEHVQKLDRYDIFDDFMALVDKGQLIDHLQRRGPQRSNNVVANIDNNNQLVPYGGFKEEDIITFDDKNYGYPQFYNAYVLYATEDQDFVDGMVTRMREKGLKLCTEEDLLPHHITTYTAVSRLVASERCYKIIMVYSPEFLKSAANSFYNDFAYACGIESGKPKILPCVYRSCTLPSKMTFSTKLYYPKSETMASKFWDRLVTSLTPEHNSTIFNGINGVYSSSLSGVNIEELPSTRMLNLGFKERLALPAPIGVLTPNLSLKSSIEDPQPSTSRDQPSTSPNGTNKDLVLLNNGLDECLAPPALTWNTSAIVEPQPSTSWDYPATSRDHPSTSRDHPSTTRDHPSTSPDHPSTTRIHPSTSRDHPSIRRNHPSTSRDHPSTSRDYPLTSRDHLSTSRVHPSTSLYQSSTSLNLHSDSGNKGNRWKNMFKFKKK